MSIDRSRRISFEQQADLYAEARPGYLDQLVADIIQLTAIPDSGRMLEIGCGPGNATVSFARLGYRILALELGERLASLAAEVCRPYPAVEVLCVAFEDWPLEEQAFDLAFSADAFHWIPPKIGYPKLARALKPSGSAALFWNLPLDSETAWSREINDLYENSFPQVENPDKPLSPDWLKQIISQNFSACGCFHKATIREYICIDTLTTAGYLNLLRTFSGHQHLPDAVRVQLFDRIGNILNAHGGIVRKPRLVLLFHTRLKE